MSVPRRNFLAALAGAPAVRAAPRRTNLIVFMTDDHGPWATSATGCPQLHTPHIQRLAAAGTRFSQAFACTPVCSPSRMTYLTGLLPSHHGVQDFLLAGDSTGGACIRFLDGKLSYPEILTRNGYTCGMTGKWHMGCDETPQAGFSFWATVPGGGGTYRNATFIKEGAKVQTEGFKTDRVGDFAVEFLRRQQSSRDPFFLLVPFYAPHTPYDFQPEEYRRPYAASEFACFPRLPAHPKQNRALRSHHLREESMRSYSALITGLDANVGRVIDQVRAMGALEDTAVLFTADQGWNAGHHGLWGKGNGSIPFNMYEESIGVPMIWSHPGRIPAGRSVSQMVSSYDLFPTVLDYLGLRAPADRRRIGRSYAPLLRGRSPAWRDRLYFEYAYMRAVRTRTHKWIAREAPWPSELYDLEADPGETTDRAADPAYRGVRDALTADLERFFRGASAPPLAQWRGTTRQNLPPTDR
jgi:arylsulfatase A-like enzyme